MARAAVRPRGHFLFQILLSVGTTPGLSHIAPCPKQNRIEARQGRARGSGIHQHFHILKTKYAALALLPAWALSRGHRHRTKGNWLPCRFSGLTQAYRTGKSGVGPGIGVLTTHVCNADTCYSMRLTALDNFQKLLVCEL